MGKKYNGLFGIYLGAQYTIIITKPQVAEECLCDHRLDDGYQGHGSMTVDRAPLQSRGGHHAPTMFHFTRDGQGIAMSTGNYWKKVRGRMVAHVSNIKVAERSAKMIMEEVNSLCWSWRQKVLRGERIDDLTGQLKRESMNMGFRLLFSKRWGADLPETYKKFQYCVEYFFHNLSAGNPSDIIPALRVLPNKFITDFKKVVALRDSIMADLIAEHRKSFEELRAQGKMNDRSQSRDVCDMFFWDQIEGYTLPDEKGELKREYLTEDQLTICLFDMIFALTDTTATTNEWAIYCLINHPEVQDKLHEEMDREFGPDHIPTYEDRHKLPYFWAFMREVMRYRIVAAMLAPHYANEDITLHDTTGKEFFVPAGTQILVHAYSMGLDPELWDEPEKFNPDRFLGKDFDLDLYGQGKRKNTDHYKFMPFGTGPRMCPGYSFAKVAQWIQAATILHSFRFKLAPDAEKKYPHLIKNGKLDMSANWGLTLMPQRYGEMGCIVAEARPVTRLFKPMPNDFNSTNVFLDRTEKKVKLIVREQLSHDTCLLRFGLGGGRSTVLGLPVGKHIKVHVPNVVGVEPGKWNGREDPEAGHPMVTRAYTPTSSDMDPGYVDLLVKVYAPGTVARFPDGGKVSYQLSKLQLGDEITISGPWGLIEYMGNSQFKIGRNIVKKKFVGMMAGGSGITPMLQILRAALEDPKDTTKFSLIYANQTETDILCRETLEDLQKRFPTRFRLHYTVDRAPEGGKWKYSVGFIDAPMISEHMPPKGEDTIIFGCGPPPMIEFACKKNLEKLGYSKEQFATF